MYRKATNIDIARDLFRRAPHCEEQRPIDYVRMQGLE